MKLLMSIIQTGFGMERSSPLLLSQWVRLKQTNEAADQIGKKLLQGKSTTFREKRNWWNVVGFFFINPIEILLFFSKINIPLSFEVYCARAVQNFWLCGRTWRIETVIYNLVSIEKFLVTLALVLLSRLVVKGKAVISSWRRRIIVLKAAFIFPFRPMYSHGFMALLAWLNQ